MDSRFSIDATNVLSSGAEADGRQAWIVWFLVVAFSLAVVIPIVGAPFAQSSGHSSVAAAIYRGFSFICHQIPDRSLHLAGYQFAVCSRCTGIYFGFAGAALFYPLARSLKRTDTPSRLWLFLAAVPLGVDFALGYFSIWENTHWSRFLTGALLSTVAVFYVMPGLIEGASIVVGWFSRSDARIPSQNQLR